MIALGQFQNPQFCHKSSKNLLNSVLNGPFTYYSEYSLNLTRLVFFQFTKNANERIKLNKNDS